MESDKICSAVDTAFDNALKAIQPRMESELYPAAFADSSSWLRVKSAIDLNNAAIRQAVKTALRDLLPED